MTVELEHMHRIKQKLIESGSKVFSWNDRLKLLEMIEMEIKDLLEESGTLIQIEKHEEERQ